MKTRRTRFEPLETRRLFTTWQNQDLPCDVDASGLVTPLDALVLINELNQSGPLRLEGFPSVEDRLVDVSGDGLLTPLDALRIINVLTRYNGALNLALSVAPQQDANSNGVVTVDQVQLTGQSAMTSKVAVRIAPLDAMRQVDESREFETDLTTNEDGLFSMQVPLRTGTNLVTATVRDPLGRTKSVSREVVRGDFVSDWNAALLNVVRDWTTTSDDPYEGRIVPSAPPIVARNLALIHTAMFDAMNGVLGQYESYLANEHLLPPELQSGSIMEAPLLKQIAAEAAGITAAYETAKTLYPDGRELAVWNATQSETLGRIATGAAKEAGQVFGQRVAASLLSFRSNDGSDATVPYEITGQPGDWSRTAPDFIPPLLPQWRFVQPFVAEDIADFRPAAPPELASETYAEAVEEVMRLGGIDSSERTADQTEIAVFWADGGGTATPPGHWNRIAADVSLLAGESSLQRARTMALLNLALADAGIASWDAKYVYDLWRPIDAIRKAELDGNGSTLADATWLPLLKTPPFPSYTSGHSTFSGAGAEILTLLFGNDYAFASTSDGHSGLTQRPLSEITTRQFASFWEAAEEAGLSRIYGGIHYSFDNTEGLAAGSRIAQTVTETALRPLEP